MKTHHPWNLPGFTHYDSNKTLVCVRNPIDSLASFYHLFSMYSHSAKVPYDVHKEFPEHWTQFVREISSFHARYYDTLFSDFVEKNLNPTYFVRLRI